MHHTYFRLAWSHFTIFCSVPAFPVLGNALRVKWRPTELLDFTLCFCKKSPQLRQYVLVFWVPTPARLLALNTSNFIFKRLHHTHAVLLFKTFLPDVFTNFRRVTAFQTQKLDHWVLILKLLFTKRLEDLAGKFRLLERVNQNSFNLKFA